MLKRELKKEDFLGVIKGFIKIPDKTERSLRNPKRLLLKKIYFNEKLQKDHLLLVVIEQEGKILKVVTLIDTSKISKYL